MKLNCINYLSTHNFQYKNCRIMIPRQNYDRNSSKRMRRSTVSSDLDSIYMNGSEILPQFRVPRRERFTCSFYIFFCGSNLKTNAINQRGKKIVNTRYISRCSHPQEKGVIISRCEHVTVYPPNLLVSLTGAAHIALIFCSLSARVSESGETIIKCQPKHFLRQHTDYNPGETSGMKNSSFMIFREDDIQSYTNRYDMILLKSSSKPSSSTNTTSPGSAN